MQRTRTDSESLRSSIQALEKRASALAGMLRRTFLTHTVAHPDPEERVDRGVMTFVFRIVVLLLAEGRGLLHKGWPGEAVFFALREGRGAPGLHDDGFGLWKALERLFRQMAQEGSGRPGRPEDPTFFPAGGLLFNSDSLKVLNGLRCPDRPLHEALTPLISLSPGADVPPGLLGRLYEGLLPSRVTRRRSGAYYTNRELVDELIRSALVPVAASALKKAGLKVRRTGKGRSALLPYDALRRKELKTAERALLDLNIVDPACGGAAFLLAAHDFLARELARIRSGTQEPPPAAGRRALEDVLVHCIHGVDKEPMAVELAKVSLWLNARARDLPQGALDRNIKCGDALVGVPLSSEQPDDSTDGWPRSIPSGAYTPLDGDCRKTAAFIRDRNRREMLALRDSGPSPSPFSSREACDLWTAAFFQSLDGAAGTSRLLSTKQYRQALDHGVKRLSDRTKIRVRRHAAAQGFFHWRFEFPAVFSRRGGGFDCVLSNPPWERIKLQEREFFARSAPDIACAGRASSRERLISKLKEENPSLHARFTASLRESASLSRFLRYSGRYALASRGDPNFYLYFTVLFLDLIAPSGRAGLVVPSGIATDHGASRFFSKVMARRSLVSLYDFVNRKGLFKGIAGPNRFCLLTLAGPAQPHRKASFQFYGETLHDLSDRGRRFSLSGEDLMLLNPNTRTCPPFTGRGVAKLMKRIYTRIPVLCDESGGGRGESPWGVRFFTMFHMSSDSPLFRTREQLEADGYRVGHDGSFRHGRKTYLRLYEAKLMHNLNHRYNTFEGVEPAHRAGIKPRTRAVDGDKSKDPDYGVEPRYWVPEGKVNEAAVRSGWTRQWFLALRSITNVTTNRRSVVAAILPWCGIGNSAVIVQSSRSAREIALLAACLSSFAFDYAARQKLGGPNLNYFILKQLPVPPPRDFKGTYRGRPIKDYILPRVLEMVYTAHELKPFAMDCCFRGASFSWDEERRARLQAELDAVFFHMYGMTSSEVEAALDTFPILERQEMARFGEFRQRRLILEVFKKGTVP